jgi:coproporphyrinogen III oxidase-like Fe-S oxidoreductase
VPCEQVEAFVAGAQDVRLWSDLEAWIDEGILERSEGRLRFSQRGYLVSNEVLSRFV